MRYREYVQLRKNLYFERNKFFDFLKKIEDANEKDFKAQLKTMKKPSLLKDIIQLLRTKNK